MPTHPSDKNKDVRWMGHSFIPGGSDLPVEGCYFRTAYEGNKRLILIPDVHLSGDSGYFYGRAQFNMRG
jgi:hypothetical protein